MHVYELKDIRHLFTFHKSEMKIPTAYNFLYNSRNFQSSLCKIEDDITEIVSDFPRKCYRMVYWKFLQCYLVIIIFLEKGFRNV